MKSSVLKHSIGEYIPLAMILSNDLFTVYVTPDEPESIQLQVQLDFKVKNFHLET